MSLRRMKMVTGAGVMIAGLVADPPPGELLGRQLSMALWIVIIAAAAAGWIITLVASGRRWAFAGPVAMALPLIGPIHELWDVGMLAQAAGALALVLHIELMSFAARKRRWGALTGNETDATTTYEREYKRALRGLAVVTLLIPFAIAGSFALMLIISPATLSASIEARHVEGVAAFAIVLAGLSAVALLFWPRGGAEAPSGDGEEMPEAIP